MGHARARGMGMGRRAPLLPEGRGQRAWGLRAARRRRAAAGQRRALTPRPDGRLGGRRGRGGDAAQCRLQRHPAGRRRVLPADAARWHALFRRGRLPAPSTGPTQPAPAHGRPHHPAAPGRHQGGRRGGGLPERTARVSRRARGDRVGRCLQLAPGAAALRHRPGCRAGRLRDPVGGRPAGGQEPAGPPGRAARSAHRHRDAPHRGDAGQHRAPSVRGPRAPDLQYR